ncbi:MAG: methyltransferase domain-containing protein [Alphaproteobacteria bacterium]|nr:methyltransferase domain-containing protein [Alphaproteobacteria bacterium]
MAEPTRPGSVAEQRAAWTDQAAAWDCWADRLERMAERFNQPLVEAAEAKPGDRVLDLASGIGEPGLSLLKAIQPGGRLVLSDLVPEMLQGAVRRFRDRGLAADFVVQDAQRLAFAGESFDLVTCRFGIMFFPEPRVALTETARVLGPGGRAVFLVWGRLADNPMFQVTRGAVEAVLGADPRQRDPFRHAEPGALCADALAAGLVAYAERELDFERHAKVGEPFWQAPLEMTSGGRLGGLDPGSRASLEAEVVRRLEPFRDGGGYRLGARIRVVTARKPA